MDDKLIIVTGFGPFVGHELVNASWEAVRQLPDHIEFNDTNYKIEKILVPVQYDAVDNTVEQIWKKDPKLVIHCGVNSNAKCLHLEKYAYNNKFCRPDYTGKILESPSVCLTSADSCCEKISTDLDVLTMTRKLCTKATDEPIFLCSNDVGNYLCGYIYLKSLDKSRERSLFVHVPPINQPLSSEATSRALYCVIEECLRQLKPNVQLG